MSISVTHKHWKVTLTEYTIGSAADPYAASLLLIEPINTKPLALDTAVQWETNGLGLNRLILLLGGKIQRVVENHNSFCSRDQERGFNTKLRLLAKRWTGLSLDDANELVEQAIRYAEEDPMGPASRYI